MNIDQWLRDEADKTKTAGIDLSSMSLEELEAEMSKLGMVVPGKAAPADPFMEKLAWADQQGRALARLEAETEETSAYLDKVASPTARARAVVLEDCLQKVASARPEDRAALIAAAGAGMRKEDGRGLNKVAVAGGLLGRVGAGINRAATKVAPAQVAAAKQNYRVGKTLSKAPPGQLQRIASGGGTGPYAGDVARGAARGVMARQAIGRKIRGAPQRLISRLGG